MNIKISPQVVNINLEQFMNIIFHRVDKPFTRSIQRKRKKIIRFYIDSSDLYSLNATDEIDSM